MLIYPLPKLTHKEVKNVKATVRENLKLYKAVNICFDEKKATIVFSDIWPVSISCILLQQVKRRHHYWTTKIINFDKRIASVVIILDSYV